MIFVDANGNTSKDFSSSFDTSVLLEHTVREEKFRDHLGKGGYQIDNAELAAAGEKIYAFPFNFH
jgi:hypothetical protein